MKKSLLLLMILLAAIPAHARDYQSTLDAARAAIASKNFAQAATLYQEAVTLAPNSEEKFFSLSRAGEALKEAGQTEAARALWRQSLDIPKLSLENEVAARTALAFSYYNDEKWTSARQELQTIVEKVRASNDAELQSQQLPIALFLLGQSYSRENNSAEAMKTYEQMLQVKGLGYIQSLTVISALGNEEAKAGNYERSVGWLSQVVSFAKGPEAIQIDELRQAAQLKLANSLLAQKKYAEAKEEFLRVVYWPNISATRLEEAKKQLALIERQMAPKTP